MGCVIERLGHDIDNGYVRYNERPSSFEQADKLAGRRLDRRRNYAIFDGEVRELATWSQACSGCYDGYDSANARGFGCNECGYTGRRKQGHWVPLMNNSDD